MKREGASLSARMEWRHVPFLKTLETTYRRAYSDHKCGMSGVKGEEDTSLLLVYVDYRTTDNQSDDLMRTLHEQ